jgi:hypothetical protein
LGLPELIRESLRAGEITEGHTRPLLMLIDRPEEQMTLFKEIVARRITVRDSEALARRIAVERVRHKALISPDLMALEKQLSERLGTRVRIERKDTGGKLLIDFFSPEDLTQLCLSLITPSVSATETAGDLIETNLTDVQPTDTLPAPEQSVLTAPEVQAADDTTEDDLYSIKNFSV